jgi:DnaK suppressor protein
MTRLPTGPGLTAARAERLVAAERARIEAAIGDVGGDIRAEGSLQRQQPGETWELGTDVAREGVDMAVLSGLQAELEAADRAAARIREGTFGRSIETGDRIPRERLEAVPLAERTVDEQLAHERRG